MSIKVATINPPFLKNYSRQSRSPCVAKSGTIYYAYYLAYAGCALEKEGHEVLHIDAIIDELDANAVIQRLRSQKPELIIIDTSTPSIISDIEFATFVKAAFPTSKVGLCGTFPSKNIAELTRLRAEMNLTFDFAFRGEYEQTAEKLAASIDLGADCSSLAGVVWYENDVVSDNGVAPLVPAEYLDELPFVSEFYLRHFGKEGIKRHFYASINWPYIQILSSRGCPYKCSFCNIPSIGSYRTRSVESVRSEFEFIRDHMPFVKEVFFEDDTFPINKKRTIELCGLLERLNSGITWSCNARVNTDRETLDAMKRAGCRLTCVGFESPTTDSLTGIIKKTTLKQQETFMHQAREARMKVNGCFILGLPGDNRKTMQNTVDYAKLLMPNTAQFYPHMLYPGTGSFDWAEQENMISHKDWSKWLTPEGYHSTPLSLPDTTSEELLDLCDYARKQFYLSPKYLFKMFIQSLKSPKEFQRMLIAGKTFFPLLFSYMFKSKKTT